MTGEANMQFDRDTLMRVDSQGAPPTLRFFRWNEPTVSYGRLQNLEAFTTLIPRGHATVRRPTGGGIVFHNQDLCLSLAWRHTESVLPQKPQDQYRWIHSIILEALMTTEPVRMASCCDARAPAEPFGTRRCFIQPVGYDLLIGEQKVVGGALYRRRMATLYQGSIQRPMNAALEEKLLVAFQNHLM